MVSDYDRKCKSWKGNGALLQLYNNNTFYSKCRTERSMWNWHCQRHGTVFDIILKTFGNISVTRELDGSFFAGILGIACIGIFYVSSSNVLAPFYCIPTVGSGGRSTRLNWVWGTTLSPFIFSKNKNITEVLIPLCNVFRINTFSVSVAKSQMHNEYNSCLSTYEVVHRVYIFMSITAIVTFGSDRCMVLAQCR